MTEKSSIMWNISLVVLAPVGVCAMTLVASAQQAQAAPLKRAGDPTVITATRTDWPATPFTPTGPSERSSYPSVMGPASRPCAKSIADIIPPHPPGRPRSHPLWKTALPGGPTPDRPGTDAPGGAISGASVRDQ